VVVNRGICIRMYMLMKLCSLVMVLRFYSLCRIIVMSRLVSGVIMRS